MHFIDVLNLSCSSLAIYGLVVSLRYLIPCYNIRFLSEVLNETQQLLDHAETMDAISSESEYKTDLDLLANQFAVLRTESNLGQGTFKQLRLAAQRGLTCRLYVLYYRIEGIKLKLELAIDDQQLRNAESNTGMAVPSPASATATPANGVVEPTLPLPATSS